MKYFYGFIATLLAFLSVQAYSDNTSAQERIVSIDGSVTEIIYALGAEENLVAVDTTSRFPSQASTLPDVGYMRQLSTEGILSLRPTLIIASADAGPESVFEQLKAAGVTIVRTGNEYSVAGVLKKVDTVSRALNKEEKGKQLQLQIQHSVQNALSRIPEKSVPPSALFLLGSAHRGLMAAGEHTQANAMLALVQAQNIMSYEGYKPVNPESVLSKNPDIVLIAHTDGNGNNDAVMPALMTTEAQKNNRVHNVNTSLVLGFGPRIGDAMDELVTMLYPQALSPQPVAAE